MFTGTFSLVLLFFIVLLSLGGMDNMIGWILTRYGRKKTTRYLEFDGSEPVVPPEPGSDSPNLLYIHIPFCEVLCPYCSFNRIPFNKNLSERYFDALMKEMEIYYNKGYSFESVYVGGGTPTVLPDRLAQVLRRTAQLWPVKSISVETNPNHLTDPILESLKEAKVNRLSVGVQTFNDPLLKKLKRYEKYGSGRYIQERLSRIQGTFDTLNIDMIYNLPTQTDQMVRNDLKVIDALKPDQVAFYPLIASKLKKHEIAEALGTVDYRKEKRLYYIIRKDLSREYHQASSWCFSRTPGLIDEYIVDYRDYAGLGSGSFGYIGGALYSNTFSVPGYIQRLEMGALPLAGKRVFSLKEKLQYDLLMSLFIGSVSLDRLEKTYGSPGIRAIRPALLALSLSGAVRKEGNSLVTTEKGNYYFVILMREFFNGVNTLREQMLSRTA